MTRRTYRFRTYVLRPDSEPRAFVMQCATCQATGPTSENPEDGTAWAADHLKAKPDHLAYRETITRPHRFEPGEWQ